MNEESHHLSPVGDEALEARIIAWVLGEASPFEAAELENLCEQQPEWRVFQRRMLAIHELLGEAHEMAPSAEWKLSAEKRGKLDELIGGEPVVITKKKKVSYQKWGNMLAAAAVLVMGFALYYGATGTMGHTVKGVAMQTREPSEIVSYSAEIEPNADQAAFSKFPVTPATPAQFGADDRDSTAQVAAADGVPQMRDIPAVAGLYSNKTEAPESQTNGIDNTVARNRESEVTATVAPQEAAASLATRSPEARPAPAKPAAPSTSNSQVIAGKMMAESDAETSRKSLEEADLAGEFTGDKQIADAKSESGGGGGMGGGLAQREVIRRQALQGEAKEAGATSMAESKPTDDPIRSNPAIIVEGQKNIADVRRGLYMGEGNMNLGKYDEAAREYENVLRIDPYNKSARRGLEKVAAQKSDYYRAAYDHTRSELLMEVDKAWELAIPDGKGKAVDPLLSELAPAAAAEVAPMEKSKDAAEAPAFKDLEGSDESLTRSNLAKPGAKQQQASIVLPEISAEQEPYSTFSLRVSDNAFRIAQAAMAQGQRPAPESVRVEEFYNAFDYGDPVPTAQEPVAASIEQSAHPILPQRNLLRIGLRTAASGRSAGQPLHLTLLVDQSGSMSRGDRSNALIAAVKELGTLLKAQDHVSVIGFSRTPRLLAEKIPGDQPQRLLELLSRTPSDGGTNLEEALKLGEIVAKRNQLAGAQNRLLLLTDGAANLGNADPDRLAAWVKALRQKNIAFDIAGIGTDGLNDPLLVEIARHGNGRYYVINDAVQAKQQFAMQLAGAFRPAAENVKVQVQFNPKRVGKYQLIGFEKDRLNTEDFRNDQVDAAEMAAAEAGQALYQVELLPDGTGDIGEVSVRFRDVTTQQMVERKWTIRFDATTPVFERAVPSMQLAGMAMLTAQKLQGGPVAPMIRFSEMPQAQQQIRDQFSANPRAAELLEMIRQLND